MKFTTLFALLAAAVSPAAAQVTLTVEQEVNLFRALSAMDTGAVKIIDNKAVTVPFDLSADTRFTLAKDLLLVTPDAKAFEQARVSESNGDFPTITDKDGNKVQNTADPAANVKFQAAMQKIAERKAALQLETVARGDLKLDTNPFPTQVLAGLMPIIRP